MANFTRLLILLTFFLHCSYAQNARTNLEIIESSVTSFAYKISESIKHDKLIVGFSINDPLIKNRILNALSEKFELYSENIAGDVPKLNIDAVLIKITYEKTSFGFLKKSKWKRKVETKIYSTLHLGSGKIKADEFTATYADTLDDFRDVETANFEFSKGKIIEKNSGFFKIVEPIFIITSIGIAVYLLFTVRK